MPEEFDFDGFCHHLRAGGAPFGGRFDANIGQAIDGYQQVVVDLKHARDSYRQALEEARRQLSLHGYKGPKQVTRALATMEDALNQKEVTDGR